MNGKWLDEKTERNRWDQDMDSRIREALSAQTGPFEYGNKEDLGREQALRNRVIEQIKEETKMKHLGRKFKKIAVAAGTMCILGSAVVMAAGHFKGFISSSTALEEFSSYEELEQVAENYQIPFAIQAPEQFANGYVFEKGYPVHVAGMDEGNNETKLPTEISLTYKKDGMLDVTLNEYASRAGEEMTGTLHEKESVSYYYTKQDCLFVPPSYELTEEEKAASEAGTLQVSYGTDTIEKTSYSSVQWQADGISYLLMSFESALSEEEMVEMASEVMGK